MRCRDARIALRAHVLGGLDEAGRDALRRHLDRCPGCAIEERIGRQLTEDLALLREGPVPVVDVRPVVAARIAAERRPVREEVSTGQLAGAAMAAAVCLPVLLAGLWATLPESGAIWFGIERTATLARALAGGLAAAVVSLLALPLELLGFLGRLSEWLDPFARQLQTVGMLVAAICCATMAVTMTVVVGRDLTRGRSMIPREEQG